MTKILTLTDALILRRYIEQEFSLKINKEQAEQEPVAWWFQPPNKNVRPMFDTQQHGGKWKPLYAAPVRTKDLTDDEIEAAVLSVNATMEAWITYRAVIQEFRRKNGIV